MCLLALRGEAEPIVSTEDLEDSSMVMILFGTRKAHRHYGNDRHLF